MHLRVISSVKPILTMYYNKGILRKSLNRSWKEVTVSYKRTFVTLLQPTKSHPPSKWDNAKTLFIEIIDAAER